VEKITYSKCRNNLASIIKSVNDNHTTILITRERGDDAVLMSLDTFNSYEETMYLMSSEKNAKKLSKAINDINNNKNLIEKGLIE
jgi:antitoxin YefM